MSVCVCMYVCEYMCVYVCVLSVCVCNRAFVSTSMYNICNDVLYENWL